MIIKQFRIGSAEFVGCSGLQIHREIEKTALHIKIDDVYYGKFTFQNQYREGLEKLFFNLSKTYQIKVLSGDNDGERASLEAILP